MNGTANGKHWSTHVFGVMLTIIVGFVSWIVSSNFTNTARLDVLDTVKTEINRRLDSLESGQKETNRNLDKLLERK